MMPDSMRPQYESHDTHSAPLPNDLSHSALDERGSSGARIPPPAAPEQLVEPSLVELSAVPIVVLIGLVLLFAGAIAAISWW